MTETKQQKVPKLRHLEYYDLQSTFDRLYAESQKNKVFDKLMDIICSEENIKLAYRSIKRNSGSNTPGVDGLTIGDLEEVPEDRFIAIVQKKLQWYKPKAVKRVEIPKPDGRTRPLGIPAMWDRVVKQCILQVLEPICEAKFHERSNGFRPNRSAEHAIAQCYKMIQQSHLYFVVDIDIKGFFDNVNHSKLIKQMWHLGIRDKKLICIIREMLKAPICMPDGTVTYPTRGTPQGGILSPLLSNIVLNELDWWIASQWETMPTHTVKDGMNANGSTKRSNAYHAFKQSNLKEMYIVRYADDFKIFCRRRSDANRVFIAAKAWLSERLKLEISEEKSRIVNLKKGYSEFLGFKLKPVKKRNTYVVESHVCDKALKRISANLKGRIDSLRCPRNLNEEAMLLTLYNLKVIGLHNYYRIATHACKDFGKIGYSISVTQKQRLRNRLKQHGNLTDFRYIRENYGNSKMLRYLHGRPMVPVGYVQHKKPMWKRREVCKYTPEGRAVIHKNLGFDVSILHALMRAKEHGRSIEYMDNRVSLYAAQYGKCAITGVKLAIDEIHCHHKLPVYLGGTDRYGNLIIIHKYIHRLIHAKDAETIAKYRAIFSLNSYQLQKINKLREMAQLPSIA